MESDLRIDERPTLRRPVLIAAFRGWNDGGQAATLAAGTLARVWDAHTLRRDRPRGLRRLPVDPADRVARRGADAPDRMARDDLPRGRDPRRRPRRGDPARCRAELPLAGVQRARGRPRPRPRRRARRHARRAARRRARTRGRPRSRAPPATSLSSRSSACRRRATRGRRASSASCTTHSARPGIPSVSLWSAVPHYVSLAPSPRAARALCDRLGELLGVTIDLARARGGGGDLRRADHRGRRLGSRDARRTSRSSSGGPTRSTS